MSIGDAGAIAGFELREFRVWRYAAPLKRLWLRSGRTAEQPWDIEVAFFGVEFVALPTELGRIQLADPDGFEVAKLEELLGERIPAESVVVVVSRGWRFFVVASAGVTVRTSNVEMLLEVVEAELAG